MLGTACLGSIARSTSPWVSEKHYIWPIDKLTVRFPAAATQPELEVTFHFEGAVESSGADVDEG